ncbi:hypothetical protein N0V82_004546 [Gnomoniopsis sp. IMI 355080]|nr:hypothetical protein N0V82_004546 [Gnomoniopsis sp. IMI 355080]
MNPRPNCSTTAYPREDLHRFVNSLNVRYNVGIPIPDPNLSLLETKADQSSASRIYSRLKVHFYTGGVQALNSLLVHFDSQAKQYCSSWVKTPAADRDTLPATLHHPIAANLVERDWLRTAFNKVLDEVQPSMKSSRPFVRTKSGPAAIGGDASTDRSSRHTPSTISRATSLRSTPKRRADSDIREVNKKTKADPDPDPIRDLTASSSLQRHHAANASATASAVGTMRTPTARTVNTVSVSSEKPLSRSFVSTSTRLSEASAVFSAYGGGLEGTQDTVEASSQEQQRPATKYGLASLSQDSFDLTPSLEEGLRESFEQSRTSVIGSAPKSRPNGTVCSSRSSELAALPSDVEREALRPTSDRESKAYSQDRRLSYIWPLFPAWLREAPFPVAWEVTRIGQSCGVDLTTLDIEYNPEWIQQRHLRASLWQHPAFRGKAFPVASSDDAWDAGVRAAGHGQSSVISRDQQVVYTASLDFDRRSTALHLTLQSLKVEQPHRLGRYYGADRYIEVLIPSPDSSNLPTYLKKNASFFDDLIQWLVEDHAFCGRSWKAFYTKSGGSRKPVKDLQFGPEPKPVFKDRVYFFAERAEAGLPIQPVRISSMVDWALNLRQKENGSQPVMKLFQRLALGDVMNDGVARMSPAVALQIRACLGLTSTPSAVQGRLGSAKGMWVLDSRIVSSSDKFSIETFPSQRKWVMDWSEADEHHRTLEVRGVASMPNSASFNLQFLPVIEDRAKDKASMRKAIGSLLKENLRNELDGQKRALQTPLQFRQWTHENATHKHDRVILGRVPFLGSMPQEDEEVMNMMLDAGFNPSNEFLKNLTFETQKRKCDMLMKKLNIKVGRSAYLYMVVDFHGILEENEVHVGFSTAFEADEIWSDTMLCGTDVLVARSPAHFISDIQKVKAVFKSELADLKNVIVFSSKGNTPLADKLSGGDYDGDLAWVCWEPRIVHNFLNAPPQEQPDLSRYMSKDKVRFRDLLNKHDKSFSRAIRAMMSMAFEFNLSKSMLGGCTNYKERLCYARNSVCDKPARILSTLLSNLVDQPKQGLRFNDSNFRQLLKDHKLPTYVDDPTYKKMDHWPPNVPTLHIIDYLKFDVAKPTIDKELKSFHEALKSAEATQWDEDVGLHHKEYMERFEGSGTSGKALLTHLKADIEAVLAEWEACKRPGDDSISFAERVTRIYTLWQEVQPRDEAFGGLRDSKTLQRLLRGDEYSEWNLLKASMAFSMYYKSRPRFVWQVACTQLCWIKAMAVMKNNSRGAEGAPRLVIPSIYASLRPDAKFVKQITARIEGGSHFGLGDDDDGDMEVDVDD